MKFDIKYLSLMTMGTFYILVGISHFTSPIWYVQIVPPSLPYKLELVYVSGLFEILFGGMLFFKKTRFLAGWGLILLLIAVYPANIYLAQTNGAAMNTTPLVAWGRLPVQFIFVGLAYLHSKY